jgi:hypothetical protein
MRNSIRVRLMSSQRRKFGIVVGAPESPAGRCSNAGARGTELRARLGTIHFPSVLQALASATDPRAVTRVDLPTNAGGLWSATWPPISRSNNLDRGAVLLDESARFGAVNSRYVRDMVRADRPNSVTPLVFASRCGLKEIAPHASRLSAPPCALHAFNLCRHLLSKYRRLRYLPGGTLHERLPPQC